MRAGEFPDGARVLRAKIDMASANINLRDPVIYRILHASHPHAATPGASTRCTTTPTRSDAIEGITHSICTLEFEDHRPLYDWVIENCGSPSRPQQIEFARLNLSYTVLSKRILLELVKTGRVRGWDDPRMPTISGIRRRGFTPEAIRDFCERIGVAKRDSMVDLALLEHCVREDLNRRSQRVMAVLAAAQGRHRELPGGAGRGVRRAVNNPEDPAAGARKVPFSRVLYIEREDFHEVPPPKFFRLSPGREVRLRSAYFVTCTRS